MFLLCECGAYPGSIEHVISARHLSWLSMEHEAGFQDAILTAARFLGWAVYHTYDARRSEPGFPDLVLVKNRVLFREVKTSRGRLSPEQEGWQQRLKDAGADVGVWRPADWDDIERELSR